MSIKFLSDLVFDIYVKKLYLDNIDFFDKDSLEKYLRILFKKLKDNYKLSVEGFYDITVYIDPIYGAVFHMEKEDLEYYDYFKNQVDMRIITRNVDFLYMVSDIECSILGKIEVITDDFIYIKIIEELDLKDYLNLLEDSIIIYDKEKQLSDDNCK